jgi:hypothetical protein
MKKTRIIKIETFVIESLGIEIMIKDCLGSGRDRHGSSYGDGGFGEWSEISKCVKNIGDGWQVPTAYQFERVAKYLKDDRGKTIEYSDIFEDDRYWVEDGNSDRSGVHFERGDNDYGKLFEYGYSWAGTMKLKLVRELPKSKKMNNEVDDLTQIVNESPYSDPVGVTGYNPIITYNKIRSKKQKIFNVTLGFGTHRYEDYEEEDYMYLNKITLSPIIGSEKNKEELILKAISDLAAHGYKYEILIKDSYKDFDLDEKTIKDIGEKAKKAKSLREFRLLIMPWYAKQLDIVEFKEKRFEFCIEELDFNDNIAEMRMNKFKDSCNKKLNSRKSELAKEQEEAMALLYKRGKEILAEVGKTDDPIDLEKLSIEYMEYVKKSHSYNMESSGRRWGGNPDFS